MRHGTRAVVLALACAGTACRPGVDLLEDPELLARAARLEQRAAGRDSSGDTTVALARWILPPALAEISGLTLDSSGRRLFAHNDENGVVFEIDYRRGVLLKRWIVGDRPQRADFEAIAVAGDRFFLLASNGHIYEFAEGEDEERVPFTLHRTGLGGECEFEGMAWDAAAGSMVLACKNVRRKSLDDNLVLFRWTPGDTAAARALTIPMARATAGTEFEKVQPSDLTFDPHSGNLLLVAAQQRALLELTRDGAVVLLGPLPEPLDLAEGLAVTRDSLMIVSTEAGNGPATITVYRRR